MRSIALNCAGTSADSIGASGALGATRHQFHKEAVALRRTHLWAALRLLQHPLLLQIIRQYFHYDTSFIMLYILLLRAISAIQNSELDFPFCPDNMLL